jgi:hypothetical protein
VGVNYYIALVKDGNDYELFINGVSQGTQTDVSALNAQTNVFRIGYCRSDSAAGAQRHFIGYVREFRFSNVSRYTASYAPSLTGFPVDEANTKLYIKGNENNGATAVTDYSSTTSPKTVTVAGDGLIKYWEDYRSGIFVDSCSTPKLPYSQGAAKVDFLAAFGDGAIQFAGETGASASRVNISDSDDWQFDTNNTLEFLVRFNAVGACGFWGQHPDTSNYLCFYWSTTFGFYQIEAGSATINLSWAFTPLVDVWYHVVLQKVGSDYYVIVNGTSLGVQSDATAVANFAAVVRIGSTFTTSASYVGLNGILDNVRFSKGIARYTAPFNPPEDVLTSNILKIAGVAYASIGKVSSVALASVGKVAGLA